MHYLMLVTLSLADAPTSREAQDQVYERLVEDQSFCGDGGGFFSSPICDWFVIGGRWSGHLQKTLLGAPYQAAFEQAFPVMAHGSFPASLVTEHRRRLNQLWRKFGGKGPHPLTRHDSRYGFFEDDAMIVNQALYDQCLKPYRGETAWKEGPGECRFADLDEEAVDDSFIGRKWLVVVDYHN